MVGKMLLGRVPGGSPNQADPEFVEEEYLDTKIQPYCLC